MREILFRGKANSEIRDGEWVYGSLLAETQNTFPIIARDYDNDDDWLGVDLWDTVEPHTVGQYTGLTDKNGKKIFEGDIVHYLYEPGKGYWNSDQLSVIEWNSTGFYMRGIMGTNKYACSSGWLVSTPHGDGRCFEVIGNIHDNPELLEVDKK